jgi:hypothetical protein
LEAQLSSTENIAVLRADIARLQEQIKEMSSGQAAEQSEPAPQITPPAVPQNPPVQLQPLPPGSAPPAAPRV